ncbi:MAG TPA: hypothetical protein PLN64_00920 [Candidatus Bipolaricaulis anaerobius]|nr:hypothetical protein [Candidatus Bipolaricaulis anaerobius]
MAVTLASIDPANGARNVPGDYPVTARITDSTNINPALVTVTVNGIDCTLANGLLEAWNVKKVSGGAIVDDFTNVYFGTLVPWLVMGAASISTDVDYDGSSLGSQTWTVSDHEGPAVGADGSVFLWATNPLMLAGADAYFETFDPYFGTNFELSYLIQEVGSHNNADARYYIGTRFWDLADASGVVASVERALHDASGIVEGWARDLVDASAILQGWQRDLVDASGVVAVRFHFLFESSGAVSVETLSLVDASAVVYAVNRNNVLEVHVVNPAAYAKLVAAGITFS